MSDFDKQPTDAATRKPDDVGSQGQPAVGGGHQTAEQADITGIDPGGLSDADRKASWDADADKAGRNPTPVGGSSDGQSDRKR
ncbi:hypothetical protein [Methylobacterium sp. E-045]|uniref:hypothetical protein n=1 Tax=Methylobacterium sp. E-045 TaxID=2836575 RepID=UPI001FBB6691|nr:hypothetical protein [Methylobacterium sp. E-045]MCJ2127796.1 hypothetical protein [Methylobacterium sp. E-045]